MENKFPCTDGPNLPEVINHHASSGTSRSLSLTDRIYAREERIRISLLVFGTDDQTTHQEPAINHPPNLHQRVDILTVIYRYSCRSTKGTMQWYSYDLVSIAWQDTVRQFLAQYRSPADLLFVKWLPLPRLSTVGRSVLSVEPRGLLRGLVR